MTACRTWSELVLARRDSEAAALTGERGVSYAELIELAAAAAGWLDELGIAVGGPVPALLDTSAVSLALVIAGSCTGRPIAPLGPRLTAREIAGCVAGLCARVLIAEPGYADQAAAAAERAGCACAVVPVLKPG
jgi:acyl-coenzyme A synthetase/AMP-(fatty) acid ligase